MNKRSLIFIFLIVLLALVIINGTSLLYAMSFIIWSAGILYSSNDFYNRGMLFMFLISFFVFLMGRDFLEEFFLYRVESEIPNNVLKHTYITYKHAINLKLCCEENVFRKIVVFLLFYVVLFFLQRDSKKQSY